LQAKIFKNMKYISLVLTLFIVLFFTSISFACTNFLVTKGASEDGSTMISYSADSHVLYGELYHWPAASYPEGTMLDIYEWDTGKYLGQIKQARQTYNVIGNINEFQVAIGETTYTGRRELRDTSAIMDYGSLMYIALQRSKSAREAIKVITDLMEEYGYYSSGESFSVADKNEVWILEMISKGMHEKGAVWVARLIPDGYISGHANHSRITTFPQRYAQGAISSEQVDKWFDPQVTTIFAKDVISFARKVGYFDGADKDFDFSATYAPIGFGDARFCDARVWSIFSRVNEDMDQYEDYAAGKDLDNRMPLWIKPSRKITVQDMMDFMRDTYQGTPFDMSQDVGAGPFRVPYRWRPLTWQVEEETYVNERAVATQQTGFSFVTQSRNWLSDPVGGILWFGVDDAGSTCYAPVFCSTNEVPQSFERGYGSLMDFKPDAAFWVFNQVSNLAYTRYSYIHPFIAEKQRQMEGDFVKTVHMISEAADKLFKTDAQLARDFVSDYSKTQLEKVVEEWTDLYQFLFAKFVDGNIKQTEGRIFINNGYSVDIPAYPKQPGYDESYYRKIIENTGDHLKLIESDH
jgi:dipeptidase